MIGPNLPNLPLTPVGAGTDVTLRTPGFFEQAAFPNMPPLSAGLLPMMPMGLPLAGMGEMPALEPGKKPSKKDMKKLQEMSAKMQKDYVQGVVGSFMQSSLQLQQSFAMFMGGKPTI